MKCKKLSGIEVSSAYFGYIKKVGDNCEVVPLDEEAKDEDHVYVVCDISLCDIRKLNGSDSKKECFDFFLGHENPKSKVRIESAVTFWRTLMAQIVGNETVWLVSDDGKDVFLLHELMGIVYFLGKVHTGHPLEQACQWRYKRIKA